ncbi:Gfo/Idh/MocA family protein [Actinokineospora globicatena]|uniref:Gfo/Idh/MocA family protein n=1 Tax=Actinokineospora globicatena TaxID=103729 RepID=UPI0020A5F732|nr:Gfo/Idh/MocA family oxidoreductase [Actinokineospora globicatena]MCP2301117.1 putative dehydrogenase [Actinokineospora globicatena]GLW77247.1 oxidoreductase [Actinokineospora globicatena]GLW84081.1 oxidoreductase [Actinokineospora globicatena]
MTALPRIALVGVGTMGSLHARVIAGSPDCELAVVIDPREEFGTAAAQKYETTWRPELGDLSDVDAVVVAAATEAHHQVALDVLGQGKPLLIEKPVCANLPQTEEVLALSEKAGLPIMCGLLERYNPAVMTALGLIDAPVHVAATRHSPYAPRIKTGVAWDLLVHDVDIALQVFRGVEPVRVSSGIGQFHPSSVPGAEDVVEAVLTFTTGVATVSASRIGQRKIRTLAVYELDRLIEVDLLSRTVTVYRNVVQDAFTPDGRGYRQQSIIEIPELVTAREPLATQLDRFLDLIAGRVDADAERRSILPSHRAVAAVMS